MRLLQSWPTTVNSGGAIFSGSRARLVVIEMTGPGEMYAVISAQHFTLSPKKSVPQSASVVLPMKCGMMNRNPKALITTHASGSTTHDYEGMRKELCATSSAGLRMVPDTDGCLDSNRLQTNPSYLQKRLLDA
jgi:hypothetical protein